MTRQQRVKKEQPKLAAKKQKLVPRKDLLVVVEAINKVGGVVEQFFALAAQAVQVPHWFKPEREAERFLLVREAVRNNKCEIVLSYRVPPCVLAFAKMIHDMATSRARQFFNELQIKAAMPAAA